MCPVKSSNSDLPADVIQEILLRLPVKKTLLRFKCVCKYCYALIGSPSFINQHFGHKSNQERSFGIANLRSHIRLRCMLMKRFLDMKSLIISRCLIQLLLLLDS